MAGGMGRTQTRLAPLIPRVQIPGSGCTADSERAPPVVGEEMKVPILPYRQQTGLIAVNPLNPTRLDQRSRLKNEAQMFLIVELQRSMCQGRNRIREPYRRAVEG